MKKIVLAPAVALAFTGLVASPVAAAESPSTQSSDSAEAKAKKAEADKAEKEKAEEKAAAEKEAAEKAAKEKSEKEKAEKKAADKAAKEKAAKEKAAEDKASEDKASDEKKDEKPKTPKKDDPKPTQSPGDDNKGDEGDDSDEVEELNASLKLSTQSIKAEDLAEEGLKVTVTGLEKGDNVSVNGGDLSAGTTTASGSSETLTLNTNEDAEDIATKQSVSLQVERTGVAPQSLTDTVNVQSSDDDTIDASL